MSRVLNAGTNGSGPSEAVFFKHQKAFDDLLKQKSSLLALEKKCKKLADDDGVNWDVLKRINTIRSKGASGILEETKMRNLETLFLRYMKHPLGEQLQIIDESAINDDTNLTEEEREEKWRGVGEVAGKQAKGLDIVMEGHDPNSDTGRWIREGWEKGQAANAAGIKKKPAETSKPKSKPKDEPEVLEAKKRGRPKQGGVSYWHDAEKGKVYEVGVSDATPEGSKSITREEYTKLKAEYDAKDQGDWENSAPDPDNNDGFDSPPSP